MVPADGDGVRSMLNQIGWDAQYVESAAANASTFTLAEDRAALAAEVSVDSGSGMIGFIFVQMNAWNRLAQIQGLAVHPAWQRRGVASALVGAAEGAARSHAMRGIFVDTPTTNRGGYLFYLAAGYRAAYIMPSYYEEALDGVTFQKFWGPEPTTEGATDEQPA